VRGRRALAIVRELWNVRDEIGQSRDLAPGKILRDAAIVEAARAAPTTPAALARLPGFTDRARRYERQFFEAVRRALALPERDLPATHLSADTPPPARLWKARFPEAAARLAACRAAVLAVAAQVAVPAENLVDPEALRRLAWSPPGEPDSRSVTAALQAAGARPWQVELTARQLADVLAGHAGTAA
jgi:ribonuclease D